MKYRAFLAATAMLSSSIVSPAYAAVTLIDSIPAADPPGLDVTNLALAQDQCDAAAAAADLDGPGEDTDIYTGVVVEGTVTLKSGPTEVGTEGDRDIDLSTRVGAGTFTPGYVHILGDPYRNGGSVNMFGMREAIGGHYSNSAYDFTADFKTTYTHPYTCDIYKAVYHPAVAPGTVQGYYTNPGEGDCRRNRARQSPLGRRHRRLPLQQDRGSELRERTNITTRRRTSATSPAARSTRIRRTT